jgi:predicted DsbA family dithiol-disulfide isomerase
MKVEIWSDIVCPFCYIGKRRFEAALKDFAHKEEVEVVWRSFQLDPDLKPVAGQSVHEYLARRKGISLQEATEMNAYMAGVAREVGLHYDFDNAIRTNTLNAHRLTHLAAKHGRQDAAEEKLFAAYYSEGKDIGNPETLVEIGESVGLNGDEIRKTLQSEAFKAEVLADQDEAQQLGVRGVPFFVFNQKYAVSGAQPSAVFLQTLERTWQETEKPPLFAGHDAANACGPDGNC